VSRLRCLELPRGDPGAGRAIVGAPGRGCRRPGAGASVGACRPRRPAPPSRARGAGSRARRRPRARVAGARGRGAGDREVHAASPGCRGPLRRWAPGPLRLRAGRLGLLGGPAAEAIRILAEHDVGRIVEAARALRPAAVIVDSIQTATLDELEGPAGSVGQVREAALRLMELAKGEGIAVILVGHVTKEGSLAGPKTLEHLVDAVISIEGERGGTLRLVRASKNRFGATDEVGVLEMAESGLREVADPARAFLVEHPTPAPGSVVAATLEGSRALLVEVQALVASTGYGTPRRTAIGLDPNRLALLVAVLGRRAGVGLGTHDVYANLAGGIAVADPGLVLPLDAPGPTGASRHRRLRRGRPPRGAARRRRHRAAAPRSSTPRLHASARSPGSCFRARRRGARRRGRRNGSRRAGGGARDRLRRMTPKAGSSGRADDALGRC
jgi:hypothetical protein